MSDEAIYQFLKLNDDFFVRNNLFSDAARSIGWFLVTGLRWIVSQCENLYDLAFSMVDFTTWGDVGAFIDSFKWVFVAIMSLSLLVLGIMLTVNPEKKPNVFMNLLIAIAVMTTSTVLLNEMNSLVKVGKDAILGNSNGSSANQTIANNVYDLLYFDSTIGLKTLTPELAAQNHYPSMSDDDVNLLDINEVCNYESDLITTEEGKKILQKRLIYVYGEDLGKVDEVSNGIGWNDGDDEDLLNDFYYRYKVDYFPILVSYLAMALIFIFISYKVFRLIIEIASSRVLAALYAADLTGGQKIIKILQFIRDSYIVLLFTAVLIRLYYLGESFISANVTNVFSRCVLILFLAFTIIDGPNLIEKLTGIDAGLSSGAGKIMGLMGAARGAAAIASGAHRLLTGGATRAMKQAWEQQHQDALNQTEALNNLAGGGNQNMQGDTNAANDIHNGMNQSHNQTNNEGGKTDSDTNAVTNTENHPTENMESSQNEGGASELHPDTSNLNQDYQAHNDEIQGLNQDMEHKPLNENGNVSALNGFDPESNQKIKNPEQEIFSGLDEMYKGQNTPFQSGESLGNRGTPEFTDTISNHGNSNGSEPHRKSHTPHTEHELSGSFSTKRVEPFDKKEK